VGIDPVSELLLFIPIEIGERTLSFVLYDLPARLHKLVEELLFLAFIQVLGADILSCFVYSLSTHSQLPVPPESCSLHCVAIRRTIRPRIILHYESPAVNY